MDKQRIVVDTVDEDGNQLSLAVLRPTNKINQDAHMAYNLKLAELIRRGSQHADQRLLMRAELEDYLQKMGIWTLEDRMQVEKLALEIRAHELMLKKGGIKMSEGRAIALQMAEKRQLIMQIHAKRQQFDSVTVESQAENFKFEFLLIRCMVAADTGKPVLKNHSEYVERQNETAVVACARVLANMVYGLETDVRNNMFEMQWLKDAGMIDDDGRYVRGDGTFTDRDGRLVNKDGRYINEDGQMVDTFGRPVDEKGNLLVDTSQPFINDDTGEEVVVGTIGVRTKTKNTKSKRTKKTKTTAKKKTKSAKTTDKKKK